MFEGVANLKEDLPVLLVLNKKDLIKPGEISKRIQVCLSDETAQLTIFSKY